MHPDTPSPTDLHINPLFHGVPVSSPMFTWMISQCLRLFDLLWWREASHFEGSWGQLEGRPSFPTLPLTDPSWGSRLPSVYIFPILGETWISNRSEVLWCGQGMLSVEGVGGWGGPLWCFLGLGLIFKQCVLKLAFWASLWSGAWACLCVRNRLVREESASQYLCSSSLFWNEASGNFLFENHKRRLVKASRRLDGSKGQGQ